MQTNTRKGFTLIELLIVVVIIGILAAIAIPKFANTKDKAYIAAMKTDLRNLATAQEGYFADSQMYGDDLAKLGPFTPTAQVSITLAGVSASGWNATAKHAGVTGKSCTIGVGVNDAVAKVNGDGVVKCQ